MSCAENHRPCTIESGAHCGGCDLKGKLTCDPGNKQRGARFYRALAGLVLSSLLCLATATGFVSHLWWTIPVYLVYWVVYWLGVELFVHCPHCPYWDDQAAEINCLSTCGVKKPTWQWLQPYLRQDRRPYTAAEKATIHVFNAFSMIFPTAVLAYAAWSSYHWAELAVAVPFTVAAVYFLVFMRTKMCSGCANVACSMNALPKDVAEAFVAKNPMRDLKPGRP